MTLWQQITVAYPELTNADFDPIDGSIHLRDDKDGTGAYIAEWTYSKPIPAGLKLGK